MRHFQNTNFVIYLRISKVKNMSVSNCPPEAEFLDEIITYLHLIQEMTLLCNLASFTSRGKSSVTGLSDDGSVYGLGRHLTVPDRLFSCLF